MSDAEEPTIEVRQFVHHMLVSDEVAMDAGLIPDTRTPPTRRRRWQWATQAWWRRRRPHIHLGPCSEGEDL